LGSLVFLPLPLALIPLKALFPLGLQGILAFLWFLGSLVGNKHPGSQDPGAKITVLYRRNDNPGLWPLGDRVDNGRSIQDKGHMAWGSADGVKD
jgi:hypothetical protein